MQATLSVAVLKPFIKALTCLSRYGDDLVLYADAQHLTLSATNSSLSAYCRFRYGRMFFLRYRVGGGVNGAGPSNGSQSEPKDIRGQLLIKTLLSIFKHRTIEKAVERCELIVTEGLPSDQSQEDEDNDTLESRLIVRLYCKHGIVKTHRLPLLIPTSLLSPGVPESDNESRLTIGPRAVRDITEHFPSGRGVKSDPQLVWIFGDTDVDVKSLESSIDTKGRAQLATELTISADEFDVYDIAEPPITIAFHLREFNATIAFAESMASALELRFTDPAAPLFIDIEGDESDALFVISTSQFQGTSSNSNTSGRVSSTPQPQPGGQKRPCAESEAQSSSNASESGRGRSETPRMEKAKRPMKAVQRSEISGPKVTRRESSTTMKDKHAMPPPSVIPAHRAQGSPMVFHTSQSDDFSAIDALYADGFDDAGGVVDRNGDTKRVDKPIPSHSRDPVCDQSAHDRRSNTPLFFPSSQLSQQHEQAIRESGLGIEYMNQEEFEAMLEGDGEEVEFGMAQDTTPGLVLNERGGSLDLFEDEFGPTQDGDKDGKKAFQPLFED